MGTLSAPNTLNVFSKLRKYIVKTEYRECNKLTMYLITDSQFAWLASTYFNECGQSLIKKNKESNLYIPTTIVQSYNTMFVVRRNNVLGYNVQPKNKDNVSKFRNSYIVERWEKY